MTEAPEQFRMDEEPWAFVARLLEGTPWHDTLAAAEVVIESVTGPGVRAIRTAHCSPIVSSLLTSAAESIHH